jgi:hypothetical protein
MTREETGPAVPELARRMTFASCRLWRSSACRPPWLLNLVYSYRYDALHRMSSQLSLPRLMTKIDPTGPVAPYRQIAAIIRTRIEPGEYSQGSRIPRNPRSSRPGKRPHHRPARHRPPPRPRPRHHRPPTRHLRSLNAARPDRIDRHCMMPRVMSGSALNCCERVPRRTRRRAGAR